MTADPRDIGFRSKRHRDAFLKAVAAGWRWRQGGNHIVLYPPDGSRPLILSTTDADSERNYKNNRAGFRRAGLDVRKPKHYFRKKKRSTT